MNNLIQLILAILLFGCLLDVPYGYFQFIRISGCIGFLYLANREFNDKRVLTGIFSTACAILLNPIFKIHFSRALWNKIDFVIGLLLLIWLSVDIYSKSYKDKIAK